MEKIEKSVSEVLALGREKRGPEKTSYEGLQEVEDKSYNGGTSIKYWM